MLAFYNQGLLVQLEALDRFAFPNKSLNVVAGLGAFFHCDSPMFCFSFSSVVKIEPIRLL